MLSVDSNWVGVSAPLGGRRYARPMPNAARELADLLKAWTRVEYGKTVYLSRGSATQVEPAFIDEQVRACGLLGQVGEILQAMEQAGEDTEHYRVFLPKWWNAVVLPNEHWGESQNHERGRALWEPETLASLRGFAAYLDKTELRSAQMTPESRMSSRSAVDDVMDILRNDVTMSDDIRRYVFGLATEIRTVLDSDDARVDVDLVRRINELRGFLGELADALEKSRDESTQKTGRRLKTAYRKIAPRATKAGVAIGFGLAAVSDALQISGTLG